MSPDSTHDDHDPTRPLEVAELRRALEEDAAHHVPEDVPTRPDLLGDLGCPACHGNQDAYCATCRGAGSVTRATFIAWRESGRA